MGDKAPSANESTRAMLQALAQYAPDAIYAINDTAPDTARTQLAIDKELYPQYYELDRQNQLQGSKNELEIAKGTGAELADQATALQQKVDPEFYKSRALVSDAIGKYLGSYDPSTLSPTEMAQIERGIGREGPVTPSAMNTIKNAQTFGDKATQRWQNFGNAVTQAASALPALKTGFTGFEVATKRALSPLPANSTTAIGTNYGFANNVTNEIGANQRAALAKKKDVFDKINSATQSFNNVASSFFG